MLSTKYKSPASSSPTQNQTFDDYVNSAREHFNGTQYEDLFNSNPYLGAPSTGLMDVLGDMFGFATNQDRMQNSAKEYIAQLYQSEREEAYNSPEAQAERMRQGGQNPDLLGTSGVSPATEFDMPQTSPDLQGVGDLASVAGSVVSVFNMALGMYGKFQNLKASILANDEKEFSLLGGFEPYAKTLANELYSQGASEVKFNRKNFLSYSVPTQNDNEVIMYGRPINGLNRRNYKRLADWMKNYYGTAAHRGDYYESGNKSVKGRREYAEEIYRPDSAPESAPEAALQAAIAPILEDEYNKRKHKASADLNQEYERHVISEGRTSEPDSLYALGQEQVRGERAEVAAETAEAGEREQSARTRKERDSVYSRILDNLAKESEKGNGFASFMVLLMSALSNMSASYSRGPKGITKGISF